MFWLTLENAYVEVIRKLRHHTTPPPPITAVIQPATDTDIASGTPGPIILKAHLS